MAEEKDEILEDVYKRQAYWKAFCRDWLLGLGMLEYNLKLRDHEQKELSHYSKATTDFEFRFPFGWGELWGIADRTDFDLNQHILSLIHI